MSVDSFNSSFPSRSPDEHNVRGNPAPILPMNPSALARRPRHLIYHLYPIRQSVWRDNIAELRRRISVFTGRRVISVALDNRTETLDDVLAEIRDLSVEVRFTENDPQRGETNSLLSTLSDITSQPGLTFYAHAKGVTHQNSTVVFGIWSRLMYTLLDQIDDVFQRLSRQGFCGLIRATGQPVAEGRYQWHYPGSFYWFRNDVVAQRGWDSNRYRQTAGPRFFAEELPSRVVRFTESAAIYTEILIDDPYRFETWQKLVAGSSRPLNSTVDSPPSIAPSLSSQHHAILNTQSLRAFAKHSDNSAATGGNLPNHRDPPIRLTTPLPSNPVRHMLYHIWPNINTDAWKWNITQLRKYITQFDGVRSIGVATTKIDGEPGIYKTATLSDVQREFRGARIDNWIEIDNDPTRGESATFVQLMKTLPANDGDITWYGHAKGVRHVRATYPLLWAEVMYKLTLDNTAKVVAELDSFPITGCFKRYGEFNLPKHHVWHYSGTFFWFRNKEVFNKPDWFDIAPNFFSGVEAWPSRLFSARETGCIFGDNAGNLYEREEWLKHQPELQKLGIRIEL